MLASVKLNILFAARLQRPQQVNSLTNLSGKQYKAPPTQTNLAAEYFFLNVSQNWFFKKSFFQET